MKNYDDIINMPHHTSTKYPRMSVEARAAQFAAFAALTGFEDAIKETSRLTSAKIEQDEYVLADLNKRLNIIKENMDKSLVVEITYFKGDEKKEGGSYVSCVGEIKKIDEYNNVIIMRDKTTIPMCDVSNIEGELFDDMV